MICLIFKKTTLSRITEFYIRFIRLLPGPKRCQFSKKREREFLGDSICLLFKEKRLSRITPLYFLDQNAANFLRSVEENL